MQPAAPVITVSELNRLARLALERTLPQLWVAGEVSNFTRAASGHWYFTLKDAQAAVRCAMYRNRNQLLDWTPTEGMRVEVRAQPTLYEPRGEFQLMVESMRRAGLGALYEAFLRLKEKLAREGLFDPARKRPLPRYPRAIGLVTSPQAAALHDVLTTLARRWPAARVILYPTPVQGEGAATQIAAALALAGARAECEVLLLVRGGGSLEDLWAYNEEVVVRAIAASPIPVVSGIGHETDFTIADFVADARAPTPTGAAQLATPDAAELRQHLAHLARRLNMDVERRLNTLGQRLDGLARRLRHPAERLAEQRRHLKQLAARLGLAQGGRLAQLRQRLQHARTRLRAAAPRLTPQRMRLEHLRLGLARALAMGLARRRERLETLAAHLNHLDPHAVLARGFSLVRHADGRIVRTAAELALGETVRMTFAQGEAEGEIRRLLTPPEARAARS
ncbi:MAG: exodeoxyribonuclease VII large subunit [Thiobacillaceae bacterium]|nr:exodeoxyribonuclease VII large subunit [Thiobacillaceae bacterium]